MQKHICRYLWDYTIMKVLWEKRVNTDIGASIENVDKNKALKYLYLWGNSYAVI